MKFSVIVWITIILVLVVKESQGQGLCSGGAGVWAGLSTTVSGYNPGPPAPPNNTFILYEQGSVNCFGVVAEWRAVVPGRCADLDISFNVWRVVAPVTEYELIGYNKIIPANCVDMGPVGSGTQIALKIPQNARLPIADTDVLGWHFSGGNFSLFETKNDGPLGSVMHGDCSIVKPFKPCSPGSVVKVDYQMKARLVQGPAPTIDNLNRTIDIYEGMAINTSMFTVVASHPNNQARETGGDLIVDPSRAVLFTFASSTITEFIFDPEPDGKGRLYIQTNGSLDYESQPVYLLDISVTAMGQTVSRTLTVNIMDQNEAHIVNLPPDTTVAVSIKDPSCRTKPIYTVTYIDEDDPTKFPAKKFNIFSSNPLLPPGSDIPFVIGLDTGEVFCTPELVRWTSDMVASLNLTMNVTDGMHTMAGVLTVDIESAHASPVIDNLPAHHSILENLAVPSIIYQVSASGPFHADIRLSIEEVTPPKYFYYFFIDEVSGDVWLSSTAVLDYNLQPPPESFNITVGVRDNLQTGTSGSLLIDLIWVNQKPAFSPNQYFVSFEEQCNVVDSTCSNIFQWPVPSLVLNIIDRDVDMGLPSGDPDDLTCGIIPSSGSAYFNYTSADCSVLYQQSEIDVDSSPENKFIELTVWVKDKEGVNGNDKGDVAHVYITVTNINDNNPTFLPPLYTATIKENTPGGVSLFTVTATDNDPGVFGDVTYSLIDDAECKGAPSSIDATRHFEVDRLTGLVQTKQFVDYEFIEPKFICFSVLATDGGNETSAVKAEVIITNVNDVRPIWNCDASSREFNDDYVAEDPCFYDDELRADTSVGSDVMSILSTDGEPGSDITYHLMQPTRYFSLASTNGSITVTNHLNTYVKYILYSYSRDNGSPSVQSVPPLRVRLDTYDPERQLINIIIELNEFDKTQQYLFLAELRNIIHPWFPKIELVSFYEKTEVSIYALRDNSTFDEKSLNKPKQFVDRDELLSVLRKNMDGPPADLLQGPAFQDFGVILVEPTYPVWIIDTIPGIITLIIICLLLLVLLLLGLILGLCSKYNKCCFKKKQQVPERDLSHDENSLDEDYDRLSNKSSDGDTRTSPKKRLDSVSTVHSLIYNRG